MNKIFIALKTALKPKHAQKTYLIYILPPIPCQK